MQRADRGGWRQGPGASSRDWLYEVQWQRAPLPADRSPRTWLPSLGDVAAQVAQRAPAIAAEHRLAVHDEALPELEALSVAYVVEALAELGMELKPGARVVASELAARARVVPAQRRLLERLCAMLAEVGILRPADGAWIVERSPDREDTGAWCTSLQQHFGVALQAELALLERCGPHLAAVLQGRTDPLSLLFPEGSAELAEALYQVSPAARTFNHLLAEALVRAVAARPAGAPLRVLEIGGGTASTSAFVLPRLDPAATDYLFTDISPAFTARAARKLADFPFVRYQALDIERDPAEQGLSAARFDVVIAANVLHATRDLEVTFAHVRQLLAPGGLLVMLEMVRPQRWIDLTFGLTDGWWRFTDHERRPDCALLSLAGWRAFLGEAGFTDVVAVPGETGAGVLGLESAILARGPEAGAASPEAAGAQWLVVGGGAGTAGPLVARLEAAGARCRAVAVDDLESLEWPAEGPGGVVYLAALDAPRPAPGGVDELRRIESDVCGGALRLVQRLVTRGVSTSLILVTRGGQAVVPGGPVDAVQAPLWGLGGVVALEHPELHCRRIDLDPDADAAAALADELLADLQPGSTAGALEDQIALRAGERHVPRLVPRRTAAGLRAPATDARTAYRLETTSRGMLDGLALVPAARRAPGAGEVEIEVAATALNFRDVMSALGTYPGDPGPLGSECAGTVTAVGDGVSHVAVGDPVVALAAGSFASHVTAPATFVVRRPAALEALDAVTVPVAYVTAHFALHHLGRLSAGDRVLIHAAAGGVGLAAVHLARRAGAEVFATAGSAEKRAYLESIGVTHVMSSRTLDFADQILAATGGRGVDVVLNSLSGEFISRSFAALAPGGRFLEIGKRGWARERVEALGKDIEFHVIDWGIDAERDPDLIRSMLGDILALVAQGALPALPRRVFAMDAAIDAFRFMANARHTGKVVVAHPGSGPADLVTSRGTYLVTGGLRGIGLLTAEWLVERGARHLVLLGRSAPSDEARATVHRLEQQGARVVVVQGDVACADDVGRALGHAGGVHPPLRGVVHAAGVLDDGALVQQDWARFETVMAPKVSGAWHLDRLTRTLDLDFFVLFSSVASVLGSRGQANHAAANSYLDALAHQRRAAGAASLSVNWGVWSGTGAAVRHGADRRAAAQGVGAIDATRGLLVLEQLMRERAAQATVFPVDWARFGAATADRTTPPLLSALLSQAAAKRPPVAPAPARAGAHPLLQRLESTPSGGRPRVVHAHVRDTALAVLALPASRPLDPRQPLSELGLDSLMAVELRNVLSASLGKPLPATLLFDFPTVEALAGYLAHDVLGLDRPLDDAGIVRPAAAPAPVSGHVIDHVEQLSDDEVDRLLATRMERQLPT